METTSNIKSNDIIDKVIFEQGLRIVKVETIIVNTEGKPTLTLVIHLNNNIKIAKDISEYFKEKSPKETPSITGGGVGIRWDESDIDISLKGLFVDFIEGGFKPFNLKDGENNYALAA